MTTEDENANVVGNQTDVHNGKRKDYDSNYTARQKDNKVLNNGIDDVSQADLDKQKERAPLGILEDRRVDFSSSPVNNSELIDVTAGDSHTLTTPETSQNGTCDVSQVDLDKQKETELEHRLVWTNLDRQIVEILTRVLATFRSLADLGPLDNYRVTLNASVELDQRNYNLPTTSEIQPHFASYDPLSYVLFFPNGEPGWLSKIPKDGESIDEIIRDEENIDEDSEEPNETGGRKTVTMWEYYCYKFQIRSTPNVLLLDAMTLVQDDKKPDILLTMTCNPNWPEIQTELLPGQDAPDRPDLVSKVFRAKLEDLKEQLFKRHVLGVVCSHVYVIEFQKRGLPHAHFLLIMRAYHKMSNPDRYDKIVCSEIRNLTRHPVMHELVKKHMMHGPCGSLRTSSPLKYVFKYVYKVHDKQAVCIDPKSKNVVSNEMKRFQDARYVSPPEVIWIIFGFLLLQIQPHVMALQIHLPNKQMVRFREDDILTDIVDRERDKRLMLDAFFEMNKFNVSA
nr:helicase-like protein [Tanacetum cinerariifolium]